MTIKYGDVYTLWMGHEPMVIFGSNDAILEAYVGKKNDFAGRPKLFFNEISKVSRNSNDVMNEDYGRPWEVLRRVAHSAARKFAISPKLPNLEVAVIDEVVELVLTKQGLNNPFNPKDYIYLMVYSIIASIAAGKSYSINDREFINLKNSNDISLELQSNLAIIELFPFLRFFPYSKDWKKLVDSVNVALDWCCVQIDQHLIEYNQINQGNEKEENEGKAVINDFCDALISAKVEAEKTDSNAAQYLTSENLKNVLNNLFQAGADTTRMTLDWAFLILANYPDIQTKLRKEIEIHIGNDIPRNEHRIKCDYVQSFIAEVMRFSPIAAAGAPHKAIIDSEVKGHKIPKGTTVIASHIGQLHDLNIWSDPKIFRPERFIDQRNGTFNARINNYNHPFSVGRRACLGDKLALISLFIQITRFLQKTKGMRIVLKNGPGSVSLEPDQEKNSLYLNVQYEIMIVKE